MEATKVAAHTPGPWSYKGEVIKGGAQTYVVRNAALDITVCATPRMEGNAALIAAAPDLLAALVIAKQNFYALSESLHAYPRPSNDLNGRTLLDAYEQAKAAYRAMDAAIAKAQP